MRKKTFSHVIFFIFFILLGFFGREILVAETKSEGECLDHPNLEKFGFRDLKYLSQSEVAINNFGVHKVEDYEKLRSFYEDFMHKYDQFVIEYRAYIKSLRDLRGGSRYSPCFSEQTISMLPSLPDFVSTSFMLNDVSKIFRVTKDSIPVNRVSKIFQASGEHGREFFTAEYIRYTDFLVRFAIYKKGILLSYLQSSKGKGGMKS